MDDRVVKRLDSERGPNQKNRQRFGGVGGVLSIEEFFEDQEVPSWRKQLTFRAFFVSFWLSVLFSFIVMKLNLTTGIIPSLNVSAGLLGFFFVKSWTKFLERSGLLRQPFTRQENTVIQTCVVASSGIAFSGLSLNHFLFSFTGCRFLCILHLDWSTKFDFKFSLSFFPSSVCCFVVRSWRRFL